MKNVAVITGASSGIGKQFALTLKNNINVDEIWIIARNKANLEKLAQKLDVSTKVIPLDLSSETAFLAFENILKNEQVNIKLLINASGYGKFEKTTNISYEDNIGMIKLNVEGLTKMCLLCLNYMSKNSFIINIASVAAFQPVPYINIYAATKAYVLNFSRGLNSELKKDGINVLAVCPFWTKTNFFARAVSENQIVKKYVAMYDAEDIVKRAWRDLKKGKDVSKYGFIARCQVGLCKILPHKIIMWVWKKQQRLVKKSKGGMIYGRSFFNYCGCYIGDNIMFTETN